MTRYDIVEGTTEPLDIALKDKGVAINGTSPDTAVTLEIAKRLADGTTEAVETPPTVAWLSKANGTVRVLGAETLALGSYLVRYKLTTGSSVGYCPNGEKADLWVVVPVANR
jgi:hypothetical protein